MLGLFSTWFGHVYKLHCWKWTSFPNWCILTQGWQGQGWSFSKFHRINMNSKVVNCQRVEVRLSSEQFVSRTLTSWSCTFHTSYISTSHLPLQHLNICLVSASVIISFFFRPPNQKTTTCREDVVFPNSPVRRKTNRKNRGTFGVVPHHSDFFLKILHVFLPQETHLTSSGGL